MTEVRRWSREDAARFVRAPDDDDDKFSRGVVGLRTGSSAYPGAAVLGVEAAWRAGAGFVRYVGEPRAADAVIARRPETVVAAHPAGARVGAWVVGSGTDAAQRGPADDADLRTILSGRVPVVVDAGALDLASESTAPLVLTPHARELERLRQRLDLSAGDDRVASAVRLADAVGAVVLLKGARTVVADPAGDVVAVDAGTGWLATAGTGDVLAGVIGALLAANPDAPMAEVAAAGAWLHGQAARLASGVDREGGSAGHPIVALDVAEALPEVIAGLLR